MPNESDRIIALDLPVATDSEVATVSDSNLELPELVVMVSVILNESDTVLLGE